MKRTALDVHKEIMALERDFDRLLQLRLKSSSTWIEAELDNVCKKVLRLEKILAKVEIDDEIFKNKED